MKNQIANLIVNKSQETLKFLLPKLIEMTEEAGIKNLGEPDVSVPDTCLPPDKIARFSSVRNNLYNKLNVTAKIIKTLSTSTNVLTIVATGTKIALDTTKKARLSANTAITLIPPPASPPGSVLATINNLKDLEEVLDPKLTKTQNTLLTISVALTFANGILFQLLQLLKPLDTYLAGCSTGTFVAEDKPELDPYLAEVSKQYAEAEENEDSGSQVYQGFTLEIEEEQYSPTVKRIKAVAKNSSGIVLLQTPFTFATNPQPLIDQLKLTIDTNDLKAY